METKVGHLLKLFEEFENKYIDLDALEKYLKDSNIPLEEIIERYEGASIQLKLANDRNVMLTVYTFSDGGYSLDICNCSTGLHTCVDEVDKPDFVRAVIRNVCQQTLDYEEPKKEKLELQVDMSKGVSVGCHDAATNFCLMNFLPILDDKEVKENFKKLMKLCRENKISVKGRKNVIDKLALYPKYLEEVTAYNDGVRELQEVWGKIVEEGIYTGWGDDERINQADEKRFALERLLHGTTSLSKYRSIARDIKEKLEQIEYQIEHPDSFSRTTMIGF